MGRPRKRATETAAVLPLVAVLMVAMVSFLAFVINAGFFTVTAEESKHYARFAVLAGIEEYFDEVACDDGGGGEESCSPQERYENALDRVNEVFAENYLLGAEGAKAQVVAPDDSDKNHKAVLEPGTWYANDIEDAEGNETDPPCGESPCFEPLEYPLDTTYAEDNVHPNAFRIKGKMYKAMPANFGISLLTASDDFEYPVSAIATLVPRRGCILVDVSTSMVRDTHLNWNYNSYEYYQWVENGHPAGFGPIEDGVAGFGNEFAYYIDNCNSFDLDDPMTWIVDPQCGRYYWMMHEKPTRSGAAADPEEHYGDDYIEKVVLSDADYGSYVRKQLHPDPYNPQPPNEPGSLYEIGATNLRYKIDTFFLDPASGSDYEGPQPLAAVFKGIQAAVRHLKARRVGGDMLCMIFYDQTLAWPRVLNITDDFESLLEYTRYDDLNDVGTSLHPSGIAEDAESQSAQYGADGGDPVGFERLIRHHMFPGAGAFTSTFTALQEAMRQLTYMRDVSKVPSADFIVLVGDGLTNCTSCPAECSECTGTCSPPCDNSYYLYEESMQEVQWFVREEVAPRNIPIHVLLSGSVLPHSKFIYGIDENGDSRCLTSQEAMAAGYLPADGGAYVDGTYYGSPTAAQLNDAFKGAGDDNAFVQVNADLVEVARMTGGLWAPIRPKRLDGGSCTEYSAPDNCGPANSWQLYDPFCRDVDDQVVGYFEEILNTNPYSLVDVD
jgi:hypothetical protein